MAMTPIAAYGLKLCQVSIYTAIIKHSICVWFMAYANSFPVSPPREGHQSSRKNCFTRFTNPMCETKAERYISLSRGTCTFLSQAHMYMRIIQDVVSRFNVCMKYSNEFVNVHNAVIIQLQVGNSIQFNLFLRIIFSLHAIKKSEIWQGVNNSVYYTTYFITKCIHLIPQYCIFMTGSAMNMHQLPNIHTQASIYHTVSKQGQRSSFALCGSVPFGPLNSSHEILPSLSLSSFSHNPSGT